MKLENEQTLVFIKPGNFGYCLEIFECLDNALKTDFSKTTAFHLRQVPEEIIRQHYRDLEEMPFYEDTVRAFVESKEGIILRVYSGENIIQRVRKAVGNTDPQKAEPGTVRRIFSNDSLEIAFKEGRYLNNVIHASSSREDAEREPELWRDFL